MEQATVECSIWIAASRERVWEALTEPEQIAQWLLPPALGAQVGRDTSDTLSVDMGFAQIPFATLEALEPPRQGTIRGFPDQVFTTTYSLDDENDGTRVAIQMKGFETLPTATRQEHLAPSRTGWERALENLKAYVDGTALPYPEGYIAALFGYRREGNAVFAVERSIWIAAPREQVWRAITDPVQIEQWYSPGTVWQLSALEVGGRLFIPNAEDGTETHTQVIALLDPPRHFVTRLESQPSDVTSYTLQEESSGTRLTITHSGYEATPEDARGSTMEQNAFGYGMTLQNVKAFVEGEPLPYPFGF